MSCAPNLDGVASRDCSHLPAIEWESKRRALEANLGVMTQCQMWSLLVNAELELCAVQRTREQKNSRALSRQLITDEISLQPSNFSGESR